MKTPDLEPKIKSIRVPERGKDYWDAFPRQVLSELRSSREPHEARQPSSFGWTWSVPVALACVVLGLCVMENLTPRPITRTVRNDRRHLTQSVADLKHNIACVMQDEHGLHWLIEDKE